MLRGEHPDVVEIDPATTQIVVGDADRFVREAHASPIEGERKVVVLFGADRLNDVAANRLLKTIEEPPARTHVVLVAERAERLLPTIRSRCQRVDFAYLAEPAVQEAVTRSLGEGDTTPDRIELGRAPRGRACRPGAAARRRARPGARRVPPRGGVARRDRRGGRARDGEGQRRGEGGAPGARGAPGRRGGRARRRARSRGVSRPAWPQARRRLVTERQRRELRRARTDAWIEGITAIETLYRDVLAGGDAPRLNLDRRAPSVHPRAAVTALDACRRARDGLIEFNANETLTMQRLLLHLPSAALSDDPEKAAR